MNNRDTAYLKVGLFLFDRLSQRELDVLFQMCTGKNNNDIGKVLYLESPTVENYVHKILNKLRVTSRTQAVIYAFVFKIIDFKTIEDYILDQYKRDY